MKISVMTLGCKVNKYESDALIYNLSLRGFEATDKLEFADIYVINTCAVTNEAEKKSRQMIARCKKFNKNAKIFVCGCASQKNTKQFQEKGVSCVMGVANKIKIADYIVEMINDDKRFEDENISPEELPSVYEDDLIAKQLRTRAYIKIQDGCNNFCSYCIIPYLRGRSRSRAIFSIINEVSMLPSEIKEVVLTGINVTDYKIDGEKGLLTLLKSIDGFDKRLRLSSMEDTLVEDGFVEGLSKLKNFCPHFHLSLQSGCDETLKRMNRHYTCEEFKKSVELIRKYFPLAGITTDVIVGFPEESDEEFFKTYQFIKEVNFSELHIFQYSPREGTAATKLYKDLPGQIKHQRSEILQKLNEKLHKNFIKKNKTGKVLIEEKQDDYYIGYTENYIKCYIKSKEDIVNEIVTVKIKSPFKDGAIAKITHKKKM